MTTDSLAGMNNELISELLRIVVRYLVVCCVVVIVGCGDDGVKMARSGLSNFVY